MNDCVKVPSLYIKFQKKKKKKISKKKKLQKKKKNFILLFLFFPHQYPHQLDYWYHKQEIKNDQQSDN